MLSGEIPPGSDWPPNGGDDVRHFPVTYIDTPGEAPALVVRLASSGLAGWVHSFELRVVATASPASISAGVADGGFRHDGHKVLSSFRWPEDCNEESNVVGAVVFV